MSDRDPIMEMRSHIASCPKCKAAKSLAEMCQQGVDLTLARMRNPETGAEMADERTDDEQAALEFLRGGIEMTRDGTLQAVLVLAKLALRQNPTPATSMDCECGERMTRMKHIWHCDGCGRSRKL